MTTEQQPPNRRCPVCTQEGHDSNGDHLFLAERGDNWVCNRVEHHPDNQFVIIPHDPGTGLPVNEGEIPNEPHKHDDRPLADSSGSDSLSSMLEDSEEITEEEVEITLSTVVEYRNVPAPVRSKYGITHEVDADGTVMKVRYPMYENGKLVAWKVREVDSKKFYKEEV